RLTKATLHFRYQENEPKRTQTGQTKKLFLRNEPKSSWYSRIINPFGAKAYEAKTAFSLSRKRTQTNPTPGQQDCIFTIKKTNPNEPNSRPTRLTHHASGSRPSSSAAAFGTAFLEQRT
ncbi:MAG: hypothetical protein ACYTEL_07540, partial [Planctomycetota bacterium]